LVAIILSFWIEDLDRTEVLSQTDEAFEVLVAGFGLVRTSGK
jgi:hypothetical protein